MTANERAHKLTLIARLTADELRGWAWAIGVVGRQPFDGEQEALIRRAKQLGLKNWKVS